MGAKTAVRRRRAGSEGEGSGGAGGTPGREGRAKRHTPEERRAAVEAFHKSGLTQKAFARQWDVSHVTLGAWLRKHAAEGPQGLERVASGPAKRRGRAPLPAPVREEEVAVQRRFTALRSRHVAFGRKEDPSTSRRPPRAGVPVVARPRPLRPAPRHRRPPGENSNATCTMS